MISDNDSLASAISLMEKAGTDLATYEIKEAGGGFPKSVVDTLCAFANTAGGTVILGISEKNFKPVDNIDVRSLQSELAQAARNRIEPPLPIDIQVLEFEGKLIVVANVSPLPTKEKPCFVKKHGRIHGSFVRTGDGDHKMTIYEIDRFLENQHHSARFDCIPVLDATFDDLDSDLVSAWLNNVRNMSFGRQALLDDETLLANRRIIAYDNDGKIRPTIAGLLALGIFPQKFFPRLNVTFTVFPSITKGGSGNVRYTDGMSIDGSIPTMITTVIQAAKRNMKHGAIITSGLRENVPDYPLIAIREAIANALMHRDLSPDSHGMPVRVELYPDRLLINNPGGLYGSLTVDKLGKNGATLSRNQFLARILEDVSIVDDSGVSGHVVENRGTGIPTIEKSLSDALLAPPSFSSSLIEFETVFFHRSMTQEEGFSYSRDNTRNAIIAFISEKGSVSTSELSQASGLSAKTVRDYLTELLESGVVEGIGHQFSPKRRYRLTNR
ncbi:ATP-binding protein [Arcanobacterium canis]